MKKLSYDQLKKMRARNEDFSLINVLPTSEFKRDHIPGSFNIPNDYSDFSGAVAEAVGDKDRKVVVYCAGLESILSRHAAQKLDKAGFTDVYAYEGGMKEWLERSGERRAA
jgi:rhodanese-related sulfurtransferase